MKRSKVGAKPSAARLQEIDALFSSGGLVRNQHLKEVVGRRALERRDTTSAGKPVPSAEKKRSQLAKCKPGGKSGARNSTTTADIEILRVPEWEPHRWLVHGFSTRAGGVSTAYRAGGNSRQKQTCGELNLGFTATDTRENVIRNRELFVRALLDSTSGDKKGAGGKNAEEMPLHLLRQIHSGVVHRAESHDPTMQLGAGTPPLAGDGWIATKPGTLLGIQTADCIPVLLVDVRQRIVAAFHAGWRGTLARIVERGVGRLRAEFGSRPVDLTGAIGPGIGTCCYSVGEEVRMEFRSQFRYADELFQEVFDLDPIKEKYPMLFLTARAPGHSNLGPSLHLDLVEANRRQLLDAGLAPETIHPLNLCTACDTNHFFSHRAEHGCTGRMVSAIGIRP